MPNIKNSGQIFTPEHVVNDMLLLKQRKGNTLEPSSGNGSFPNKIKNCIAIEKDKKVISNKKVLNIDFFDYSISNKFDTVIGNPPYVKHNDIEVDTREKLDYQLFDKRTNLFLFFIKKSIDHLKDNGELIFITPREFINLTSAKKLNQFLWDKGTITDFIDLGDGKIFNHVSPNVAIWRFEKDNFSRTTNKNKVFKCLNGKLMFLNNTNNSKIPLSESFDIKVGGVSGADSIFTNKNAKYDFVCSYTVKTGKTKKMFYNEKNNLLKPYKEILLNRKIKKFDENNWWMWGRNCPVNNKPRIYVNCKTRNLKPFFIHNSFYYDGSILALFPKNKMDINKALDFLNQIDWEEQGFVCDGRFIFPSVVCLTHLFNRINNYFLKVC